jgi:hypothetical protein
MRISGEKEKKEQKPICQLSSIGLYVECRPDSQALPDNVGERHGSRISRAGRRAMLGKRVRRRGIPVVSQQPHPDLSSASEVIELAMS